MSPSELAGRQSADAELPLFGPIPAGCEVLRLAAVGSRCEIWKVCETRTGSPFAWKRVKPEPAGNADAVERLRVEAAALARCDGRGVVRLQRDLTAQEPPGLLLEWLDGVSLRERLDAGGPIAAGHAMWIGRQIVEGMQSLANAGFAHGSLRPEHVWLGAGRGLRLLDLGDAIPLTGRCQCPLTTLTGIPPAYLAPELQTGAPFDPLAADVYSLGAMLFEMVSGRPPFTGENPADVLRMHRQTKPPRLRPPLAADSCAELVDSLLSKEPLRRPRDLTGLLRRLLDEELRALVAWAA